MRPKLQKQSTLKLAGRIIPQSGGYNTPQLALGFIPVIHLPQKKEKITYFKKRNNSY
jgi:hypothetical protein